jgi:hypothetical protein
MAQLVCFGTQHRYWQLKNNKKNKEERHLLPASSSISFLRFLPSFLRSLFFFMRV